MRFLAETDPMTPTEFARLVTKWTRDDDGGALLRLMQTRARVAQESRPRVLHLWFLQGRKSSTQKQPNDADLTRLLPIAELVQLAKDHERRLDRGMTLRNALIEAWKDAQHAYHKTTQQALDALTRQYPLTKAERREGRNKRKGRK